LRFRLVLDEPAEGARNMAVDETLFLSALDPSALATLRLYSFRPETVSIGYRQSVLEAIDLDACRRQGVGWVRRPTGGRALLHQHELTYSVSAPASGLFRSLSVRGVYDAVSQALRRALQRLDIPLDPPGPPRKKAAAEAPLELPCLALPGGHEITSGGKKIVASAQRRTARGFLQHGSILFRVDHDLWARLRPPGSEGGLDAIGIDDLAPGKWTPDRLMESLRGAFEELFGGPAVSSGLDSGERSRIAELERKYQSRAWNERSR
jgi:lipoate-protein ligase A